MPYTNIAKIQTTAANTGTDQLAETTAQGVVQDSQYTEQLAQGVVQDDQKDIQTQQYRTLEELLKVNKEMLKAIKAIGNIF